MSETRDQLIKDLLSQGKTQQEAEHIAAELIEEVGDRPNAKIADPDETFKDD